MAASDSSVPFSLIDGAVVIYDGGSNSHTVAFVQTEVNWSVEKPPRTEARSRNKHHTTVTMRKMGDGNVTGSLSALVTSLYGSASVSLYEVLTTTGGASGWATVGAGDFVLLRMVLTGTAAAAGGATQTVTFAACEFSNVKVDPGGADGLWLVSADFIDHENQPTIA